MTQGRFLTMVVLLFIMISDLACHRIHELDARLVDGVDRAYLAQGRHRKSREIRILIDQLPRLRQQSLEKIATRSGLRPLHPDKLAVVLLDDQPYSFAAKSRIEGKVYQTVVLNTGSIVSGTMKPAQVLTHELTHAVMRQAAGSRYARIPNWFREGAAVWIAGQIRLKGERDLLSSALNYLGTERLHDGIDTRQHTFDDYMEDGLAFEWLEKRKGVQAIHRVIASVIKGVKPTKAFERECGLPWSAVRREMGIYSAAYIESLSKEVGYPALRATRESFRLCLDRIPENCNRALSDLKAFLENHPDSFLVPVAWFRIGRVHFLEHRFDEAINAFETARHMRPSLLALFNYMLGRTYMKAKRWDRARVCFETLLSYRGDISLDRRRKLHALLCRVYQKLYPPDQARKACRAAKGVAF